MLGCGSEPPFSRDAKEEILTTNLEAIRDAIDTYRERTGSGPQTLHDLVEHGELRRLPLDPMVRSSSEWKVVRGKDGTIVDVRSASSNTALDGSRYNEW